MNRIKDKIIYHLLEFLETGDTTYINEVLNMLNEMAKIHNIPVKRNDQCNDVKGDLMRFIINKEGYVKVLPDLINSVRNCG